jgi:hypothetical protein
VTTIQPGPGSLTLTGHSVALQILGDLKLNPAGSFYPYALTYLVASAGLTPVYDATNHPEFLKNVAGIFPGLQAARRFINACVAKYFFLISIPDKPNMAVTTQLNRMIRRHDPKYSHALVCFKFMYVCILRGSGIGRGRLPGHRKI